MNKHSLDHILTCHPIKKTDIVRGENTDLYSKDGSKIIDFEAGMWCTALGHCHPRINRVIIEQINKIMNIHYKLTPDIAEILAVNLLEQFHFQDGKATFLSSGSEAVALAMRISKLISESGKMLTFSTSYLSTFSNTSPPRDKNLWVEVDFLQCSHCEKKECTHGCNLLKHIDFSNISTFVLEPATCGRVLFPPYPLIQFLTNEIKKYGGIIVANEVTTGLGRAGTWFGYQHYDIEPDIVALGKALGNGYPISAVVMKKEIADRVERKNFYYAQSHQNDPLGCTIANEVITIMKEDHIIDRSRDLGEYFLDQLKEIQKNSLIIKNIRGRGLMLAVELTIDHAAEIISEKMLEEGYFVGAVPAWNTLRFSPALTISKNDIAGMCKVLKHVLM
ncbi:MAG: aspartate aminotransferase family protein [Bacillota bacterium]